MKSNDIISTPMHDKLIKIRERPEIYFGEKSLFLLKAYIDGYTDRQYEIDGNTSVFAKGFQEFIQNRYDITSTQSWVSIIRFYSTSNADAFNRFYDLFDEFLKLNGLL